MTTAGIVLVAAGFAAWGVGAVWVSVIDLKETRLPTRIIWSTAGVVLALYIVASIVESEPSRILEFLLAGGSCGAIFYIIHYIIYIIRSEWLDLWLGDVRLVTLNGLTVGWFGISAAWVGMALGFVVAFPLSVWFLIRHGVREGLKTQSPFGPFLVAGAGLSALLEVLGINLIQELQEIGENAQTGNISALLEVFGIINWP